MPPPPTAFDNAGRRRSARHPLTSPSWRSRFTTSRRRKTSTAKSVTTSEVWCAGTPAKRTWRNDLFHRGSCNQLLGQRTRKGFQAANGNRRMRILIPTGGTLGGERTPMFPPKTFPNQCTTCLYLSSSSHTSISNSNSPLIQDTLNCNPPTCETRSPKPELQLAVDQSVPSRLPTTQRLGTLLADEAKALQRSKQTFLFKSQHQNINNNHLPSLSQHIPASPAKRASQKAFRVLFLTDQISVSFLSCPTDTLGRHFPCEALLRAISSSSFFIHRGLSVISGSTGISGLGGPSSGVCAYYFERGGIVLQSTARSEEETRMPTRTLHIWSGLHNRAIVVYIYDGLGQVVSIQSQDIHRSR